VLASQRLLGRNPLSDAPYWNLSVVLSKQGPGRHRYKQTRGFASHLTNAKSKEAAEANRLGVGSWNVGSLMGKCGQR
jgi:hypothetical protein